MSSKPLGKTVYELYLANGSRFGFRVVSWRPRHTYAEVRDFGRYVEEYDDEGKTVKVWESRDPHAYITTASSHRLGFQVAIFRLETNSFEHTAMIFDTPSWQIY